MSRFKDYSKNILTKALLALLVISFVLFGISSFLLEGSNSWVAKIDGRKVSIQKLQQIVNFEKNYILKRNQDSPELRRFLDSAQFQIDVLGKILNEELITTIAHRYGIKPDRTSTLKQITKDENFIKNGKFDHRYFKNILAANGISEDDYIKSITNQYIKQMAVDTVTMISPIDKDNALAIANLKEQTRYADQIIISQNNFKSIKAPNRDDLQTIYQGNIEKFRQEESRDITLLKISKKSLINDVKVSNKEVKDFYDQNTDKFQTGEKRSFLHLSFDKKEQADDFLQQLKSSQKDKKLTFYKLAKSNYQKNTNQVLVKDITKNDSLPEITSRLFELDLIGDISDVFKSDLGYHVIMLDDVKASSPIKFSILRNEIKKQLLEKKRAEQLAEKTTQISNFIASSNSLSKTKKKFKISSLRTLKNISLLPQEKENKSIKDLRNNPELVNKIFSMEDGQLSNLIEMDNDIIAIKIEKIRPAHLKKLSTVKNIVREIYYKEQREQKALNLAKKVSLEVFAQPKNIRKIATKYGLKLKRYKKFKRYNEIKIGDKKVKQSSDFLENLFDIKVNQATNYFFNEKSKSFEIAVLKKIQTPKYSIDTKHTHYSELSNSYRQEFSDNFNSFIEKEHDVEINKRYIENLQRNSLNE